MSANSSTKRMVIMVYIPSHEKRNCIHVYQIYQINCGIYSFFLNVTEYMVYITSCLWTIKTWYSSMIQEPKWSLVHVMACCLFRTKPLPEPTNNALFLVGHQGTQFNIHFHNSDISFKKMQMVPFKIAAVLSRSQCVNKPAGISMESNTHSGWFLMVTWWHHKRHYGVLLDTV